VSAGHHHKISKFWNCDQEKLIFIRPLNDHAVSIHGFLFIFSRFGSDVALIGFGLDLLQV
jgi:hypothetical protein